MRLIIIFQFLCLLGISKGLKCWTCQEMSPDDCAINGRLETCVGDDQTCETMCHRNGEIHLVTKGCKLETACRNNTLKNTQTYGTSTTCNSGEDKSICTSCCNSTACNADVLSCVPSQRQEIQNATCPQQIPSISHGSVTCSRVENSGTVCQLECINPYEPIGQDTLVCLTNGSWNKPKPCCQRPCPPYLVYDSGAVFHVKSNKTFQIVTTLFTETATRFATGYDATLFAGIYFSGTPRLSTRYLFNDYGGNATRLSAMLRDRFIPVNTEDGLANIGSALEYALDTFYLEENGARPNVPKILIILTDSNSDDSIEEASRRAKELGYFTYVFLIENKSDPLDHEEFLNFLGGNRNHLYRIDPEKPDIEKHFSDVRMHFCTNSCPQ